jgi:hypothetical protein
VLPLDAHAPDDLVTRVVARHRAAREPDPAWDDMD